VRATRNASAALVGFSGPNRGFLPGYEAPWIDERRGLLEDVRLRALE